MTGWKIDVVGGEKTIGKELGEAAVAEEEKIGEPVEHKAAEEAGDKKEEDKLADGEKKVKEKKPKKTKSKKKGE